MIDMRHSYPSGRRHWSVAARDVCDRSCAVNLPHALLAGVEEFDVRGCLSTRFCPIGSYKARVFAALALEQRKWLSRQTALLVLEPSATSPGKLGGILCEG